MNLFLDVVSDSLLKHDEELCGDKVEIVRSEDSYIVVLADGLGSGVKANILATLTAKIIATMLSQGATLDDAVSTITATLPVCQERNVAYSTFTLVHVAKDGHTVLAEFDNPLCVLYRDQKPYPLTRDQVTISDKVVYLSSFEAQEQDLLVLFSDGVVHAGVGKLLDLGWMYENVVTFITDYMKRTTNIRKVLRGILESVQAFYLNEPGDDSTVCVMQFKRNVMATVMVGPPSRKELDHAVVEEFLQTGGYRVVCGGTTSQIVAAYLQEEVIVEPDYESPNLPPTAKLKHIDLVTEGVLTLGKAAAILGELNQEMPGKLVSIDLPKQDGAHRLVRMWVDDCTEIKFMVGRAINPAHQNADLPISLNLKLQLVKECAMHLQAMGKKVSIQYY